MIGSCDEQTESTWRNQAITLKTVLAESFWAYQK